MRKAQAAMEFLMTYGWAILVVLAAIGALAYFGVLSPGNLLPQKCEFTSGFDCTETPSALAGATNTITVALTNSNGYDLDISLPTASSTAYSCNAVPLITPKDGNVAVWKNGVQAMVQFSGCNFGALATGDRYKDTITFNVVSVASGLPHAVVGTVAGKLG